MRFPVISQPLVAASGEASDDSRRPDETESFWWSIARELGMERYLQDSVWYKRFRFM